MNVHSAWHIQEAVSNSLIDERVGTDSEGFRVNTCDTAQTFLKRDGWKPGGIRPKEIGEALQNR